MPHSMKTVRVVDRHRPHGLRDGRAPRQGGRRRHRVEPHAREGGAARGTARRSRDSVAELAACDIVFVMVSTWDDVQRSRSRARRACCPADKAPKLVVECSSISLEGRRSCARCSRERGVELLAAPVSGNAKVIKAGRLSFVCSGPQRAFDAALPYLKMIAPSASYVGEGELARIVKICHNVLPRRRDAVARRDHGARAEGRRAAARVPRFHEPERDGLDVLALQDAGVRQPRLQGDVHAAAAAQGPRPRPRRRPALRRADAARLDHPRPRADDDRPRHDRARISRKLLVLQARGVGYRARAGERCRSSDGLSGRQQARQDMDASMEITRGS